MRTPGAGLDGLSVSVDHFKQEISCIHQEILKGFPVSRYYIGNSIVVSIPLCHSGDPGSIPGCRVFGLPFAIFLPSAPGVPFYSHIKLQLLVAMF